LSRYNIEYVEQPVPADDIEGLAKVRSSVPVPVAADEALSSLEDLERLMNAGAADIFILKAARLGGLKSTLDLANLALKKGHEVVVTTSLESRRSACTRQPSPSAKRVVWRRITFRTWIPLAAVEGRLATPGRWVRVGGYFSGEKHRSTLWADSSFPRSKSRLLRLFKTRELFD
jgi:L-alanine-DL-glutamate epimerase-like enolase superfamily enzyme